MNIGIDISQSVYEGTGSARYVDHLIRGLAKGQTSLRNYQLTLFGSALKKRSHFEQYASLATHNRIYPFPPAFFELIWNTLHVGDFELFAGKVDLYHSSDWTQAPSRAINVTTVHDLIPFLFPQHVHPRIRAAHDARWKWIVKEVQHVIVDAECTKKDIIARFEYPDDCITVIPLGVEERFFQLGEKKLKFLDWEPTVLQSYNLTKDSYILSVGTLEPRKNIARLVQAYSKLPLDLRKQFPLVIVGKKAWANEIHIPQDCDVRFTGYVQDTDLPSLYASAKLFTMPSLYEGFGIPVLEAMACNTPVLASQMSSLPEVGDTTIEYFTQVNDESAMATALEKALIAYPQVKVSQAYKRAQTMTWQRTVDETLQLYHNLFSSQ